MSTETRHGGSDRRLIAFGIALTAVFAGVAWLSRAVPPDPGLRSVGVFLVLFGVAFAAYVGGLKVVLGRPPTPSRLKLVLLFAVLARLVSLPGAPLFDDDIYRYLWDGEVTAAGINPYGHAPAEVTLPPFDLMGQPADDPEVQAQLQTLDRLNELWFEQPALTALYQRINYPDIPTIYPPLCQAVFAVAALLAPHPSVVQVTFKAVFVLLDLLTVWLVVCALRRLQLDESLCLVYAWSPLMIKEVANSGHMEPVAVVLVALAVVLAVSGRRLAAVGAAALAIGAKLYPVLLLPVLLRELARREGWRRLPLALAVVAAVLALLYLPFLGSGEGVLSGTRSFGTLWEMNAGPFGLVRGTLAALAPSLSPAQAALGARLVVALLLCAWIAAVLSRRDDTPGRPGAAMLAILGGAYLLSPVQNPWYLCWLLPLLCLQFRWSWVALTGGAALYYLYYPLVMDPAGAFSGLAPVVLWAQYIPFVGLLIWEWRGARKPAVVALASGSSADPCPSA